MQKIAQKTLRNRVEKNKLKIAQLWKIRTRGAAAAATFFHLLAAGGPNKSILAVGSETQVYIGVSAFQPPPVFSQTGKQDFLN